MDAKSLTFSNIYNKYKLNLEFLRLNKTRKAPSNKLDSVVHCRVCWYLCVSFYYCTCLWVCRRAPPAPARPVGGTAAGTPPGTWGGSPARSTHAQITFVRQSNRCLSYCILLYYQFQSSSISIFWTVKNTLYTWPSDMMWTFTAPLREIILKFRCNK